jgi:hypothetical protein|tara:strand:+ start:13774 stop:13926 length:153 start_codon:yes stop_codon:yes gene_type:complete
MTVSLWKGAGVCFGIAPEIKTLLRFQNQGCVPMKLEKRNHNRSAAEMDEL